MKKVFAGILAFLYLSTSMGATIHLHYCMGKLISWGISNHDNKHCDYCGMLKSTSQAGHLMANNGCCSDRHEELKTDLDQNLPLGKFEWSKLSLLSAGINGLYSSEYPASPVCMGLHATHAPPVPDGKPVFLRNCNFRI
jgi:hypothetical protein